MLSLHEHIECEHTHTLMSDGFEACSVCGECIGPRWEHEDYPVPPRNLLHMTGFQKGTLNRYERKSIQYTSNYFGTRRERKNTAISLKFAKHFRLPAAAIQEALPIILKINFKGQVLEFGICAVLYCIAKTYNVPVIIEDFVRYFEMEQRDSKRKRTKESSDISASFYHHIRSVMPLCPFRGGELYIKNLVERFGEGYLTTQEKEQAYSIVMRETIRNIQGVIGAIFSVYIKGKKGQGIKERFYVNHAWIVTATTIRNKRKKFILEGLV